MKRSGISNKKIKSTICFLFYITLGTVGVIWIKKSFDAYFEGKTFFTERNTFLTNVDRPTLTICFEHVQSGLSYGSDYVIVIMAHYNYSDVKVLSRNLAFFGFVPTK